MSSSPGKPVKANIFAAGAVLWRKSPGNPDEIEIALIHRPKYEDWSFPKGKLDPGETAWWPHCVRWKKRREFAGVSAGISAR